MPLRYALALLLALSACSPGPPVELTVHRLAGTSLERTFEDGQYRIEVRDDYAEPGDAGGRWTRTFQEAGQDLPSGSFRESPAKGMTLPFQLRDGQLVFQGEEDAKHFEFRLDFEGLLPDEPVSKGDSWTIDHEELDRCLDFEAVAGMAHRPNPVPSIPYWPIYTKSYPSGKVEVTVKRVRGGIAYLGVKGSYERIDTEEERGERIKHALEVSGEVSWDIEHGHLVDLRVARAGKMSHEMAGEWSSPVDYAEEARVKVRRP